MGKGYDKATDPTTWKWMKKKKGPGRKVLLSPSKTCLQWPKGLSQGSSSPMPHNNTLLELNLQQTRPLENSQGPVIAMIWTFLQSPVCLYDDIFSENISWVFRIFIVICNNTQDATYIALTGGSFMTLQDSFDTQIFRYTDKFCKTSFQNELLLYPANHLKLCIQSAVLLCTQPI